MGALKDATFIIKTFERPQCLTRLLDSLRRFYPDAPVLVADDSEKLMPPVRRDYELISLPHDVGLSAGRNELLRHVKTPFFVLLDDDFVFTEETRIEALVEALLCGHDIAAGGLIDEDGSTQHYEGLLDVRGGVLRYLAGSRELRCGHSAYDIVFNFFAARTDRVRRIGWDEELKLAEHTDAFLSFKDAGLSVVYIPEVRVGHVQERKPDYWEYRKRGHHFFDIFVKKRGLKRVINFKGESFP